MEALWDSLVDDQGQPKTMKMIDVVALDEVADDMNEGEAYYDDKELGVGDYFFDSRSSFLVNWNGSPESASAVSGSPPDDGPLCRAG